MDQLLTPRGLVLTLASFFGRGVGCGNPVRLRARGSFWLGVGDFFWGGVLVLFCAVCFATCFCFFLVYCYLTLALFWVRLVVLVFVVGQFWGLKF